jgi:hypothetical protein
MDVTREELESLGDDAAEAIEAVLPEGIEYVLIVLNHRPEDSESLCVTSSNIDSDARLCDVLRDGASAVLSSIARNN